MTNTDETQTTSTASETSSFWRRTSTLMIGGGLAVAALLAGGIGIGSAMTDDDDDGDERPAATRAMDDDSDNDAPSAPASLSGFGAKDAAALTAILSTANKESGGTPTSMEAHRNGAWSVDFEAVNGDETTVLVAADGTASVVRTEAADGDDTDDPAPAGKLTEQNLVAAVRATLAQVKGVIVEIDLDDNADEAYSVQVLTSGGTETDVDLNTEFEVTTVDIDND